MVVKKQENDGSKFDPLFELSIACYRFVIKLLLSPNDIYIHV